jgi:AcrR family transcriptional regulator
VKIKSSYHHGNAREAIIKSATEILENQGIAKLNLRLVAEKCGLSATACYRHFHNKEHLLAELAKIGYQKLMKLMQDYMNTAAIKYDPKLVLPLLGKAYIDFAMHNPNYFNLMLGSHAINPATYPELKQASADSFNLLKNTIAYGIAIGQFKGDFQQLTMQAWAFVHGLATLILTQVIVYETTTLDMVLVNFTASFQHSLS